MEEGAIRVLWRPVRPRVVLKYSGQLAVMVGLFTLVPVGASIALGDLFLTPWYVALAAGQIGVGALLARIEAPTDVHANEALVIPALSFIVTPILYAGPPLVAGIAPLDSLFESVSGITTTGLSTLGSVEGRAPTLLFVRAWEQWIGGLGVVVFALALFMGPGMAARRLGEESLASDGLVHSTRSHARSFLLAYTVLTVLGMGALWLCGLSGFDATNHALAAVSTGGFSTHDASLAAFPSLLPRAMVIALSMIGALSFSLYLPHRIGDLQRVLRDPGLVSLIFLSLGMGLLVAGFEPGPARGAPADAWPDLLLVACSAQTTAGFSSVSVTDLAPASKLALVGAMLVGGNVGSTAGGIKLLRMLVLVRVVQTTIRRRSMPEHAVVSRSLDGRQLDDDAAVAALSLAMLFVVVVAASWLPFVAYGYSPLDALFEVASATGTVGLSTGISRPGLEAPLKWILCADMWLGRLEVLPLLVVLYPATWRSRRTEGEA